jgi:hypothetical protein
MRKIADGEDYPMPVTIDDPAALGLIEGEHGFGKPEERPYEVLGVRPVRLSLIGPSGLIRLYTRGLG